MGEAELLNGPTYVRRSVIWATSSCNSSIDRVRKSLATTVVVVDTVGSGHSTVLRPSRPLNGLKGVLSTEDEDSSPDRTPPDRDILEGEADLRILVSDETTMVEVGKVAHNAACLWW